MTASYSYRWAQTIVEQLEDKYPRATMILYKTLAINTRNMVALLATNDPIWSLLRDLIHKVAKIQEMPQNTLTDVDYIEIIRKEVQRRRSMRIIKRLDEVRNFDMFEEQS